VTRSYPFGVNHAKEKPANLRVFMLFWEKSKLFYSIFSLQLWEGDFLSFNFQLKSYSGYYKKSVNCPAPRMTPMIFTNG